MALLLCAASAQAAKVRISNAKCWSRGHACSAIVPGGKAVLIGRGFTRGMVVVFTIHHGNTVVEATRPAQWLSRRRLRVTVPSDAITGPTYVFGSTSTSNVIELAVAGSGTCPSTPGAGDAVHRWQPVVACVLSLMRQPLSYINDVMIIIAGESNGDPNSINNWDSNARAGDPSRGLMQVTGETFNEYHSPLFAPNIYDPAANIYAGLAYGIARYGSIPNIPGVKSANAGGPYRGYTFAAWR